MRYSGARGTLIYEKNLMSKISCQTPFKLLKGYIWHIRERFIEGGKFTDQVQTFEKSRLVALSFFEPGFLWRKISVKPNLTNLPTSDQSEV